MEPQNSCWSQWGVKWRYLHQGEKPWDLFCSSFNQCFFSRYHFHKRAACSCQVKLLTAPLFIPFLLHPLPSSKISSTRSNTDCGFFFFPLGWKEQKSSLIPHGQSLFLYCFISLWIFQPPGVQLYLQPSKHLACHSVFVSWLIAHSIVYTDHTSYQSVVWTYGGPGCECYVSPRGSVDP